MLNVSQVSISDSMDMNRGFNVLKQGYSLKSEAHTEKTLKIDTVYNIDNL